MQHYYKILLLVVTIFTFNIGIIPLAHAENQAVNTSQLVNDFSKYYPNIKWVSNEDIKNSLPAHPVSVGFDIDDTVLFSSPCFYKLANDVAQRHHLNPHDQVKIFQYINGNKDKRFWNDLAKCSEYSLPKYSAINLIHMHQQRGDQIYFITARHSPSNKSLTKFLDQFLIKVIGSSKDLHPVQFTNNQDKASLIKADNLSIYYGDSDSDIIAAREVKVLGIRFLRADNSTYQPLPNIGSLNEEVLVNSDR